MGTPVTHVYTTEFQKRGLPHAHILIILSDHDKPDHDKPFSVVFTASEDGYSLYRRRNDRCAVNMGGARLNNRWVMPYNPFLLLKFNAILEDPENYAFQINCVSFVAIRMLPSGWNMEAGYTANSQSSISFKSSSLWLTIRSITLAKIGSRSMTATSPTL